MRLYILKPTGALVQGPGNLNPIPAGSQRLKLATQEALEIQYLNAVGAAELLDAGKVPQLGVKQASHYDDVFVALSSPLTAPASATGFYTGNLNCNTNEFAAAIGNTAGSTAAETDTVALMGEVVYPADNAGNLVRSQAFPITGANRVFTGSEGAPVNATQSYTTAQVVAAIGQAAAAEPGLSAPASDNSILASLVDKTRSWLATSAVGRTLLNVADAAAGRTALGLGTAATKDTGTAAGNAVVLDGSARLPAVNGMLLTNLPAPNLASAGPIGGTTPNTAAFTDLNASGSTGVNYFFVNGYAIIYNQIGLYYSYGHGTLFIPVGSDGGTRLQNAASGNPDNLALGSLYATGTLSGRRATRTITGSASALVSASGSTPPDEIILCKIAAGGTVTIPTLGLANGQSRLFTVADAGGYAGAHTITVSIADLGATSSISAAYAGQDIRVCRGSDGSYNAIITDANIIF